MSTFDQVSRVGLICGENGTAEHSAESVGEARVALFFALVRDISAHRILELYKLCLQNTRVENRADVMADLFVMAFQTRDCRGGKGEKDVFYKLLLHLHRKYPETVIKLLPLLSDYGYIKDFFNLLKVTQDHPECKALCSSIVSLVASQLRADEALVDAAAEVSGAGAGAALAEIRRQVSLFAKYAPREGKHFAKKDSRAFRLLLRHLFPDTPQTSRAQYRKLVSKLTRFLDVPEVKMCGKRYAEIDFNRVPSVCAKKFCKAFLNEKLKKAPGSEEEETGNRFPDDDDRVQCRRTLRESIIKEKVKGKQLYPHQIVETLQKGVGRGGGIGSLEKEMLNVQWIDIRRNLLEQLAAAQGPAEEGPAAVADRGINVGKLVPLSDVSGSMSGIPMLVSIALGILISEVNHPAFRDRVVTFESNPQWVSLSDCSNIAQKVEKLARAPWGGSTNIEKAMDLLEHVVRKHRLPMAEVPDLIILSDMQFDQAAGDPSQGYCQTGSRSSARATQLERIRARFHQLGMDLCGEPYPAPRIIFWNLRAGTVGFPAQADSENVQLLSGFSPALLKCVLEGGAMETEEEVEEAVVDAAGNVTTTTVTRKVKPTPYSTLRKVLDDERYYPVRRLLAQSSEGWLQDYQFQEPVPTVTTTTTADAAPAMGARGQISDDYAMVAEFKDMEVG